MTTTKPTPPQFNIRHLLLAMLSAAMVAWFLSPLVRNLSAERLPAVLLRTATACLFVAGFLSLMWRSRRRAVRRAEPIQWTVSLQSPRGAWWATVGTCAFLGVFGLIGAVGILANVGEKNWFEKVFATILSSAYLSGCVSFYVGRVLWPSDRLLIGDGGIVHGINLLGWEQLEFPRVQSGLPAWLELRTANGVFRLDTAEVQDVEELADFLATRCRLWKS